MSLPPSVLFPANAKTLPISVTDSSGSSSDAALPNTGNYIRLVNEGPNTCFVSIGVGSQTAALPNSTPTATSTPVLAGEDVILGIPPTANLHIAAICRASGTATLDVQVGEGA